MERIEIEATRRTESGKNAMRRLRVKGVLPGVVYGGHTESIAVSVSEKALRTLLQKGENTIIQLAIKDNGSTVSKTVLMKELQRHPVTELPLHMDFYEISLKEKIEVKVAVKVIGEAPGFRAGGILEHHLREVLVRCLPMSIPAYVEADISTLNIGYSVHVSDLKLPEGVEVVSLPHEVIVTVTPPSELVEPAAAAAAAPGPTEPEVIGEKEREERRAAADASKKDKKEEPKKDSK